MTGNSGITPSRIAIAALVLAGGVLAGLVIPLHRGEAVGARLDMVEERVWALPPPAALRVASLGFREMAADVVWLLAVQYIGGHVSSHRQLPHLQRLVETVVDLDPHFVDGYTLGALFIAYTGGNIPAALDLLERGHRANPTRWEPSHDLARTYYLDLKDYPRALHWFQIADRIPGRPHYVPRFIARLYAATGERETALELWQAMRDSATSDWVRSIAEREIVKLETEPHDAPDTGGRP
ncbi:MAG: tetratricopeptide repeat protein [Zetaproteobacteria bacterium]|nr:MAG: tetratricopeptide repeat protein [Zetaproteobacteria bacterium]